MEHGYMLKTLGVITLIIIASIGIGIVAGAFKKKDDKNNN